MKYKNTALTAATHTVQRNTVVDCMAFPWMKPKALSALRDTSLESLAIETDVLVGALGHVAGQLQHPRPRHNSAWRVLSKLQRLKRRLDAAPNDSPFNLLINGRLYAPGRKRTMGGQTSNSLGSDFELAGASELGVQPDVVLELAWRNGLMAHAMPYFIQRFRSYEDDLDAIKARFAAEDAAKAAAVAGSGGAASPGRGDGAGELVGVEVELAEVAQV